MSQTAGIPLIEGWGERIEHDQLTLSITPQKYDTKAAQRIYVSVSDPNIVVFVSPVDLAGSGTAIVRNATTNPRNEPPMVAIDLKGNPPVYFEADSGTPLLNIIRIYDLD